MTKKDLKYYSSLKHYLGLEFHLNIQVPYLLNRDPHTEHFLIQLKRKLKEDIDYYYSILKTPLTKLELKSVLIFLNEYKDKLSKKTLERLHSLCCKNN